MTTSKISTLYKSILHYKLTFVGLNLYWNLSTYFSIIYTIVVNKKNIEIHSIKFHKSPTKHFL